MPFSTLAPFPRACGFTVDAGAGGLHGGDDFARADGGLGASWADPDGAFAIVNHQAVAQDKFRRARLDTCPDLEAIAVQAMYQGARWQNGADGAGPAAFRASDFHGYGCKVLNGQNDANSTRLLLYRETPGGFPWEQDIRQQLGSSPLPLPNQFGPLAVPQLVRLECVKVSDTAVNLRVFVGGVKYIDVNDTTAAKLPLRAGLLGGANNAFDAFEWEEL
jgi:hypothetical protein